MPETKDAYDIFSTLDWESKQLDKLREAHIRQREQLDAEMVEQEERVREAERAAVAVMEFNEIDRCSRGDSVYLLERVPYTDRKQIVIRKKAELPDVWGLKVPGAEEVAAPVEEAEASVAP